MRTTSSLIAKDLPLHLPILMTSCRITAARPWTGAITSRYSARSRRRLGLRFSPFITLRSGAPYDVLVGEDLYGDTFENARAAFAPAGSCPAGFIGTIGDVVCSRAGTFTTNYNPASPANLVPRDYLTMAGLVSVNIRVYRVFGFGPVQGNGAMPSGGGGGGGGRGGGGGGGRGGGAMSMGPAGGGRGMVRRDHRTPLQSDHRTERRPISSTISTRPVTRG